MVNAPEGDSNVVNVVQRSRERFYAVNVVQKATIQRVVVRTGLNALYASALWGLICRQLCNI